MRKMKCLFGAVIFVAALVFLPAAAGADVALAKGTYVIRTALNTKLAVDVDGNGTADGTNIQLWGFNDSDAQKFRITPVGGGYYKILGKGSEKALEIAGGVPNNCQNVQLSTYRGTAGQLWKFLDAGGGYCYIRNKLGLNMDVISEIAEDGESIGVFQQTTFRCQKFKLCQVSNSPITTYRALLIGNGDYPGTDADLGGPPKDVDAMKTVLRRRGYSRIVARKNVAKKAGMLSAIKSAFADAKSGDVSLFFFSGHGGNDGICCTEDYLLFKDLAAQLSKVPGKVIVMLDSCGSGGSVFSKAINGKRPASYTVCSDPGRFNQEAIAAFQAADMNIAGTGGAGGKTGELRKNKFYVLTACRYRTVSYDADGGIFTKAFVRGAGFHFYKLTAYSGYMAADADRNNSLTLKEAYSYIKHKTEESQIPCIYPAGSSQRILRR